MKRTIIVVAGLLLVGVSLSRGQVGGNISYSQAAGKARAEQSDRARRAAEPPPTATTTFVEASVLMNVKADEYVAVFGINHEGDTLAECSRKMDSTIKALAVEVKSLGVGADDLFVDFVAQNKIYGYEVQGNILQEKLVGFELKKNVAVNYKDGSLIEKLVLAAARAEVFDLIKVDYVVADIERIQDRLMDEAARITKKKIARYEKLLGIKLQPPAQVYAEKNSIHYPTQMYDSYTAFESEEVRSVGNREKYAVRQARKSSTFFFNGLDANGFDTVINPVLTEPVVQFTLYLKVKYEVEQLKAK